MTQSILVDAGFGADTTLLLLRNPRFGSFTRVKVGHVVTVKEGDHIFLKGLDVANCTVFNEQCEKFSTKSTEAFHLRDNLPQERKSVRDAILAGQLRKLPRVARTAAAASFASDDGSKGKNRAIPLRRSYISDADDDDDAEPVNPQKRKRRIQKPPNARHLKFFQLETPEDLSSRPSTSSSIVLPQRASSISSVSSTSSIAIVKPEPGVSGMSYATVFGTGSSMESAIDIEDASEELDEVMVSNIWPTEFYAVDIVEGFEFISEMTALGSLIEDAFGIQFEGIPYVKTTYNDHFRRWTHASQSAKDKALAAGRTSAGLWSKFMTENPAPYAARKAAKKRLRNAESRSEESTSH